MSHIPSETELLKRYAELPPITERRIYLDACSLGMKIARLVQMRQVIGLEHSKLTSAHNDLLLRLDAYDKSHPDSTFD